MSIRPTLSRLFAATVAAALVVLTSGGGRVRPSPGATIRSNVAVDPPAAEHEAMSFSYREGLQPNRPGGCYVRDHRYVASR